MHGKLYDVILNPIWRITYDGELFNFNLLIQYGYQMKGIIEKYCDVGSMALKQIYFFC